MSTHMGIFFTSDTHIHHPAILRYCNCPFKDVHHMNEAMYDLWASTIGSRDDVYHIGDVAFGDVEPAVKRLKTLPGKKFLVPGNHDRKNITKLSEAFTILPPLWETSFAKQKVILCHYPLLCWGASFRGAVNLFGHVHGRLSGNSAQMDVGVDAWGFSPVRLEKILAHMAKLPPYTAPDSGLSFEDE